MTGSEFDSMLGRSLAKGISETSGCNSPLFSLQKSLSVKNNGVFSLSRKVLSEGTSFLWPFLKPLRQQTRRRGGSVSGKKVPLLVRREKEIGRSKAIRKQLQVAGRQCLPRVGDVVGSNDYEGVSGHNQKIRDEA